MLPEYRSDTTRIDAVVEITEDLIQNPTAAAIYSRKEVTKGLLSLVNNTLNEQIRHDKLTSYNIPELQNIMQDLIRDTVHVPSNGVKTAVQTNQMPALR